MGRARLRRLVLYSRPGCHLCDEARERALPLVREVGDVQFGEVNIEADDRLLARFLESIPVLELDGFVIAELDFDAAALRVALLHTSPR